MTASELAKVPEFKQGYQIIRKTDTLFTISDTVTMVVQTFAKIVSIGYVREDYANVIFNIRNDNSGAWVEITSGDSHAILLEKYYKPEMAHY
jgi:hypothetical protein